MFTGIIQHVGTVRGVGADGVTRRLAVEIGPLAERLARGDSVAVNGACLTVAGVEGSVARFDVVSETLRRTTLGDLRAGERVNLERALRLGDGLDGHLVQGHVDGLAEVGRIERGDERRVQFEAGRELTDQMVLKGSVAVDGVSLTVTDLSDGRFAIALVPTTLEKTTLGDLAAGSKVNIETDLIGKYVWRHLTGKSRPMSVPLTADKLRDAGFA